MKRFSGCIFSVALGLILFSGAYAGARMTQLYIPSATGKAGETIDIPVMISKAENLAGVKIRLLYKKEFLTYESFEKGKQLKGLLHIVNDKEPGKLIIVMAGAKGVKGESFPLFTLKFKVNPSLEKDAEMVFTIGEAILMDDTPKEFPFTTRTEPIFLKKGNGDGEKQAGKEKGKLLKEDKSLERKEEAEKKPGGKNPGCADERKKKDNPEAGVSQENGQKDSKQGAQKKDNPKQGNGKTE